MTREQERAINESGNLLVSAGAGAGKTYVLTKRIARIITEGARMDELLIVTFTRAAAAEMKQRIEKELSEIAEKTEDAELKKRLSAASASVFRADISTIDVFCRNVLKRNYDKVGLDPAFITIDDAESEVLMDRVLDEVIEEFYVEAEKNNDDTSLFLSEAVNGRDGLAAMIKKIHANIKARPDPMEFLRSFTKKYEIGPEFDEVFKVCAERFIRAARKMLRVSIEKANEMVKSLPGIENGEAYFSVINEDMMELNNLTVIEDYDLFYNAMQGFKFKSLPRKRGVSAPEEITDYRKEVKDSVKKIGAMFALSRSEEERIAECFHPVIEKICELTEKFIQGFTALKRENSQVDFTDLEQLCLEALKDEAVAEEYRNKYSHIFIDEYQDTNSLQDSIFKRIASGGNLFMVGDVKQSIYRFRQAEPEIFLEKYETYDAAEDTASINKRIDLNFNFRSETAVLSAVNRVFFALMRGETGEIDYSDNAELRSREDAGRGGAELDLIEMSEQLYKNVDKPVENMDNLSNNTEFDDDEAGEGEAESRPAESSDSLEELEKIEAEADFIADKILDIMQHGHVFDKETKTNRKPVFSDFTVLMHVTKGFALRLVNALSKRGIPSSAELGDGYFDAIEVQVFINLLRIIDNLRQDIPLASVMLSPIGGFTEKELAIIRSAFRGGEFENGNFSDKLYAAQRAHVEGAEQDEERRAVFEKASIFIEKILYYRELSRLIEVSKLVGTLFDETQYALFAGALPNGEVRRANLNMLFERAASFESMGGRSLHGFVNYLDNLRDNSSLGAATLSGSEAVRVMSIHKSKGLEAPIVFLCMLSKKFNMRDLGSSVMVDRELGIGLNLKRGFYRLRSLPPELAKNAGKSLIRRAIEARERDKMISEEMRVLYVAMTRARERLFLVGAEKEMAKYVEKKASALSEVRINSANCFLDWLLGAFFPLGLNLENALKGLRLPLGGGDGLEVFYRMAGSGDAAEGRLNKQDFADWLRMAADFSHEDVDERLDFEYAFLEDTKTPAKQGVTELTSMEEKELAYEPAVPLFITEAEGRTLSAAERGTLTHRFIMLLELERMDNKALENRLENLVERGFFTGEQAQAIDMRRVEALTLSPLYQRLLEAKVSGRRVLREQDFSLLDGRGALIQGTLDCCFEDEDGALVLIDYKTTALKNRTKEEIAEPYRAQLEAYKTALEALTGKRVKEKWIFLLSAGEAVQL